MEHIKDFVTYYQHFEKAKFHKGLALVLHCYSEFQLSRLQASIGGFGKFKFCSRDKKPVWKILLCLFVRACLLSCYLPICLVVSKVQPNYVASKWQKYHFWNIICMFLKHSLVCCFNQFFFHLTTKDLLQFVCN